MSMETNQVIIRRATGTDVPEVSSCVANAYRHYIDRMGQVPGPMLEDYRLVMNECEVFVAELDRHIVGVLILKQTNEGFLLENIAVDPKHQGEGVGRKLLKLAELRALDAGFDSIYLYTHEKMTENRRLYARIGYAEYDQRVEKGLSRVYMRKRIENVTVGISKTKLSRAMLEILYYQKGGA